MVSYLGSNTECEEEEEKGGGVGGFTGGQDSNPSNPLN